ncbi:Phosphoribosylamine--glycine ligase [Aedoeadaptatus ivorii]|uniref:Phosphoribosylamine--glycine ligase n=1 Tax=Aedoeadaptatus ivorii TaxID=54006 RepID=A0A448V2S4_9FIRM|nr:phosphoribosylformylglycinamidine synthase [Peptoniphilus ivorii]VEJ36094.1 Phosphoribosylamine--glycine ligase [Peptoniphilus ivorii]
MKILIVGAGGREHAIGAAIAKNKEVEKIYFAPGNGGTSEIGENIAIETADIGGLVRFAKEMEIDFTVVGPEAPLVDGIVDRFEAEGLSIFGPKKAAARLEGSKAFAKDFCVRHGIPTAAYIETENEDAVRQAARNLLEKDRVCVLKADGLAAGKGVKIVRSEAEVEAFVNDVFDEGKFESDKVVVEAFLEGFEMSLLAFCDSKDFKALSTAKDHKSIYEGGRGPNTGGMGTYAPNVEALPLLEEIEDAIVNPFMAGLAADGMDYRGLIFIGIMIGNDGPQVLEFNCRFGDPETQSVLERLDGDLLTILCATAEGRLGAVEVKENEQKVVSLTLASGGYPASSEKGVAIEGLGAAKDVKIFHAGTRREGDALVTDGGRVLTVTATDADFDRAMEKVYAAADAIRFENKQIRRDIGPKVSRVYVERREGFDESAKALSAQLAEESGIALDAVKIYARYDLEGLTREEVDRLAREVLAEPATDRYYIDEDAYALAAGMDHGLVVEYLPGQYDQRNAGVMDTATAIFGHTHLTSATATVYDFRGDLEEGDFDEIVSVMVNPVDQRVGSLFGVPTTLQSESEKNLENPVVEGFTSWDEETLKAQFEARDLAMSIEDFAFIQAHFRELGRDINETELAILDTYWSDHCRHTTFLTELDVEFEEGVAPYIKEAFRRYEATRAALNRTKPVSLMDLGTIVVKHLKAKGIKTNIEESEEINACSICIEIEAEDLATKEKETIPYLLMFKNETHNHPTEIEPFGGASTCLGGCIRDPLSGRAFVYQAMRVTGSADPRTPLEETWENKLPQKKITTEAAVGYASYGNQIGLPAGLVEEIYHPGYMAKRMEVGAVVGAVAEKDVWRGTPEPGDLILLLGGRTGRDGIGGATGSSKEHTASSLYTASAEVQKGNAPMERKLLRLFRKSQVASRIKRCNDFGAGGVSVAIGELADGLEIHLDKVPLKYEGLAPREIALSESQERMAVVIEKEDLALFEEECKKENLELTVVAEVIADPYMRMYYGDVLIAELDRAFIETAGTARRQKVVVEADAKCHYLNRYDDYDLDNILTRMGDLNVVSQKNLIEKFDNTVGRGTVLMPLGGKDLMTPTQAMAGRIPVEGKRSDTASVMSFGCNPEFLSENQYFGAYYAVWESVTKLVATGARIPDMYFTFQEYFEKLGEDETRWQKPFKALLGAFDACMDLDVPPIGGKDSMSGTFRDKDVPPTLVSFAIAPVAVDDVIGNAFTAAGNQLGRITAPRDGEKIDAEAFKARAEVLYKEIHSGNVKSAFAVTHAGTLPGLVISALGNDLGFTVELDDLYNPLYGDILVEYETDFAEVEKIGTLTEAGYIVNGKALDVDAVRRAYTEGLAEIFPPEKHAKKEDIAEITDADTRIRTRDGKEDVKVLIACFPGTNSEYDTADVFTESGAEAEVFVFCNQSAEETVESIRTLAEKVKEADIFAIPGGFSFSDEPDGSAKFIANILRTDEMRAAMKVLLEDNDGLVLGICNGFQALIKSGYLPYGEARVQTEDSPTLTFNDNGRHVARMVKTAVVTNDSPWLRYLKPGEEYLVPISHGEGRLAVSATEAERLAKDNQIAFIYRDNPNGSAYNIEGLLSPDGKILGKMGHVERVDTGLYKNVPGMESMPIIRAGVDYIKGKKKA